MEINEDLLRKYIIQNSLLRNHSEAVAESYLEDGCQKVDGGIYGKSITDPCLGWDKTEKLILNIANKLKEIR